MKRTTSILLLILFCAVYCFGQKETNYWYFGYNAGLDFSKLQTIKDDSGLWTDNMPKAIWGPVNTGEGCFTLADANGNLMMSSDGVKVYNKNNKQMPNGSGLKGNSSATQSGIVIPMPGNNSKYYIVTTSALETNQKDGINYSIVDMTADGGLGDVIEKNIPLLNMPTDENIASVRKPNTDEYWVIHRQFNNSTRKLTIYVWEVTALGFSEIPKQYSIDLDTGDNAEPGYLKFSSDATRFVSPLYRTSYMLSGEFNPNTGEASGLKCRPVSITTHNYGVEFSYSGEQIFVGDPDARKGYHITWNNLRNTSLFMTDLNCPLANIQIAADGRIYGIEFRYRNLYVIMEPEKGASSEIRKFSNFLTSGVWIGLPSFASTWFSLNLDGNNVFCMNTEQEFTIEIKKSGKANNISYTIWNFGDDGENSIIKDRNLTPDNKQTHKYAYSRPGKYTITVRSYDDDDKLLKTQIKKVEVSPCVLPINPNVHLIK